MTERATNSWLNEERISGLLGIIIMMQMFMAKTIIMMEMFMVAMMMMMMKISR